MLRSSSRSRANPRCAPFDRRSFAQCRSLSGRAPLGRRFGIGLGCRQAARRSALGLRRQHVAWSRLGPRSEPQRWPHAGRQRCHPMDCEVSFQRTRSPLSREPPTSLPMSGWSPKPGRRSCCVRAPFKCDLESSTDAHSTCTPILPSCGERRRLRCLSRSGAFLQAGGLRIVSLPPHCSRRPRGRPGALRQGDRPRDVLQRARAHGAQARGQRYAISPHAEGAALTCQDKPPARDNTAAEPSAPTLGRPCLCNRFVRVPFRRQ